MKRLSQVLLRALLASGVGRLSRWAIRNTLCIMSYHGFIENGELSADENPDARFLEIGRFREQLAYLTSHHTIIPLERALVHYTQGVPLPKNAVSITVDDGYASFYHLALPILQEMHVPASLFLTTGFVDQQEMLWFDRLEYALMHTERTNICLEIAGQPHHFSSQDSHARVNSQMRLKRLARRVPNATRLRILADVEHQSRVALRAGPHAPGHLAPLHWSQVVEAVKTGLVSVGSHSVSHPVLSTCEDSVIQSEVKDSQKILAQRVPRVCNVFCYPFGTRHDFNETTERFVRDAGYAGGLTTVPGVNDDRRNIFALKRYVISNRLDRYGFAARATGLLSFVNR